MFTVIYYLSYICKTVFSKKLNKSLVHYLAQMFTEYGKHKKLRKPTRQKA